MGGRIKGFSLLTILGICLSIFVVSCGAIISATPATVSSTETDQTTLTAALQSSPTEAGQATLTVTLQPSPTETRLFSGTPVFAHPTNSLGFDDTSTPISTPENPQESYRLKPWTEQDAINLIHRADQYALDNDIRGAAERHYAFQANQRAVEIALQEAMLRFPNSTFKDAYTWRLAFARAVQDDADADEWLISQIDAALNSGKYSLDSLNDLLNPYGFTISDTQSAENLFGDGKPAWVATIKTSENNVYDGLFFVVRQLKPGNYRIVKLSSQWDFIHGGSGVHSIGDQNKNGLPEIVLEAGGQNGSSCYETVYIYEWNGSAFVDLSKGALSVVGCESSWMYGPNDKRGIPTIIVEDHSSFHDPHGEVQYAWNGQYYNFAGYAGMSPLETWLYAASIHRPFSYSNEAALLQTILRSNEAVSGGPAYPDYLRFRLAMIHAMQSKREQALKEFKALVDSPVDPSATVFSSMAQKFLESYSNDESVYRACLEAGRLDEEIFKQYNSPTGDYGSAALQKVYGFSENMVGSVGWHLAPLCDEAAAFAFMVTTLPPNSKDVPSLLKKNGVEVAYSQSLDLYSNGQAQWLVVDEDYHWNLIAFDGKHFQAHEIAQSYYGIPDAAQIFHWEGLPGPTLVIHGKDWAYLVAVDKNFDANTLLDQVRLTNFHVAAEPNRPEIQFFYQDPAGANASIIGPFAPWDGYRWHPIDHYFGDDLLEYKLFVEQDRQAVADIVTETQPLFSRWSQHADFPQWDIDRYYYLAALACELSGDEQKAVQIYWQLWHDYPGGAYALMARDKLEPANP